MKSVSKKFLSVVLAALMVISCAAVAFAADADFDYIPNEDRSYAVHGFYGTIGGDGVFTLPVQHPDHKKMYTSVEDEAFMYIEGEPECAFLDDVKTIVVPDNIKLIGASSFRGLPAVESIIFKGDVTLDENAFADCATLKSVVFEGNVTLKDGAFAGCPELTSVSVKDSARVLTVRSALSDTKWFKNWAKENQPDFVMLGTTLVAYKGNDKAVTIPLNVTVIGGSAFEGNNNLEKIVITKFVDTLGACAFMGCSSLEEVVYSDFGEITSVGNDVYYGTPYFNNFEGEFFTVGSVLLKYKGNNKKAHVRIPNTITAIADNAFVGNYLTSAKNEVTYVISSITVPASVEKLGENCFNLDAPTEGKPYAPRIFAYAGTKTLDMVKAAGYLVSVCYNPADVDGNGVVNVVDARLALRIAVKLDLPTDLAFCAADVDGDGYVTVSDARTILRLAVGLEKYTAKDLLFMPTTDFEILQVYTKAMKTVARYNAGYTKEISSKIAAKDVNAQHKNRLLKLVNKGAVNSKTTYAPDTQAALDNINYCSLISTEMIKNATCAVDENDNYVITIVLKDFNDAKLTSDNNTYVEKANYISKVMPIVNGVDFYNAFNNSTDGFGKKWFRKWVPDDDKCTTPCVRYYSLDYTEPTVKVTLNRETLKLSAAELSLNYKFAVDGRMGGVDISGKHFKVGDATFDRLDKITYSDFTF